MQCAMSTMVKLKRVHKQGDKQLAEEKKTIQSRENKMTMLHRRELAAKRARQQQVNKEIQRNHEAKMELTQKKQEAEIKKNEREYHEKYRNNQRYYRESLKHSQENYLRALANQRKELAQKFELHESAEKDPFYRILDFGGVITEYPRAYVVEAEIPEHEMKNVDVRVQKDRISFAGTREFNDEVKTDNGKLMTSRYQTVRQEFPLDRPIQEDKVIKTYEDGLLRVTVLKV
jgi:HSP20 family molecular chaperone IbpA